MIFPSNTFEIISSVECPINVYAESDTLKSQMATLALANIFREIHVAIK